MIAALAVLACRLLNQSEGSIPEGRSGFAETEDDADWSSHLNWAWRSDVRPQFSDFLVWITLPRWLFSWGLPVLAHVDGGKYFGDYSKLTCRLTVRPSAQNPGEILSGEQIVRFGYRCLRTDRHREEAADMESGKGAGSR